MDAIISQTTLVVIGKLFCFVIFIGLILELKRVRNDTSDRWRKAAKYAMVLPITGLILATTAVILEITAFILSIS